MIVERTINALSDECVYSYVYTAKLYPDFASFPKMKIPRFTPLISCRQCTRQTNGLHSYKCTYVMQSDKRDHLG